MKKNVVRILTAMLMLSMVFSSSVFAASETKVSAWDAFVGMITGNGATTTEDTQVDDGVTYRTHIQNEGWAQGWVSDGDMSGSEGKGLRLEGIEIKLDGAELPEGLGITYRTHIQNEGWAQGWVAEGEMSGSEGKGLRLEGIEIKLTGEQAANYSVQYRTHIQNEGWAQGWVADGAMSGSEGKGLRLEGIEIKIVKVAADLTAYEAALAAVGALEEADYTAESWAALQSALTDNVVTEENTQAEVDAAAAAIQAAIDGLAKVLVIESATPKTTTKVEVFLSKAVDGVTADNFKIAGLTVTAATLADDSQTVTLSTTPATPLKDYTVTATGLEIEGVVQADTSLGYKMLDVNALYNPTLTADDYTLKADGAASTKVTYTLRDAEGNKLTDVQDVVVSFSTTFGNFGEKRVTVQNGEATVMFTSETLASARKAALTATIIEAQDTYLLELAPAATVIVLDPSPADGSDDSVGARVVEAEAAQADRIILYFNKEIDITELAADYAATVTKHVKYDGTTTAASVAVNDAGLMALDGNKKAAVLMLDVETATTNALDDNDKVMVDFTDSTGTVPVNSQVTFNITDARKPEMTGVSPDGLKTLVVTFSEAVATKTGVDNIDADRLDNWSIDGKLLSNTAAWGNGATVQVGTFNAGVDNRHVVTITLGKNADGKQIYFPAGTHSVQAANIGDWAAMTDTVNNTMNTQTMDFVIAADENKPEASVKVQSPEQWLLTFNRTTDADAADIADVLELRVLTDAGYVAVNSPGLVVKSFDDSKNFMIETNLDWTQAYNTAGTNENYYNDAYQLYIPEGAITNVANGKTNDAQNLALIGPAEDGTMMNAADVTSPVIEANSIVQVTDTLYKATMSEPVKLSAAANAEGTTPSQSQTAGIPTPTARFIKADYSVTVPGKITGFGDQSTANYDQILTVVPDTVLEPGNWILAIESISDDIGNTASTVTGTFTVGTIDPPEKAFKIDWAYADFSQTTPAGARYQQDGLAKDGNPDAIYVHFTDSVMITGDFKSALETQNYTVNGKALPDGTQIVLGVPDYVDGDKIDNNSITILLPDGTITSTETTILNVTKYIKNADDTLALQNPGEKKLSFGTVPPSGGSTDLPAYTVSFLNSLTPGMKTVAVDLDTTTPDKYTVAYDGFALTYDAVLDMFKADVYETVDETLTPVITEIPAPVMPEVTEVKFLNSLTPGMQVVMVTLNTTTPELYQVTYDGTVLTYDAMFSAYKADISESISKDLTPVVTLV